MLLSKKSLVAIVVTVVVISGFAGMMYFPHRAQQNTIAGPSGYPGEFNATPASAVTHNNTTVINGNQTLLEAYVQAWAAPHYWNPYSTGPRLSQDNYSLVINQDIGSRGYSHMNVSFSFMGIVHAWMHFLNFSHQVGDMPSMSIAISYIFTYNASYNELILYNGFLPFNPFSIDFAHNLSFNDHPDIMGSPHQLIPVNKSTMSSSSYSQAYGYTPDHLPRCTGYDYGWVLKLANSTSNSEIPLAFANDTSSTQRESIDVSLGSTQSSIHFSADEGYYSSSTVSYTLGTTGSWNTKDTTGNMQLVLLPPSLNKHQSFGYIYVIGNLTLQRYQEIRINCDNGQKTFLNSYFDTIFINSLNKHDGHFDMGYQYDGYIKNNATVQNNTLVDVYDNSSAINTLGLYSNTNNVREGSLAPGGVIQWGTIISSLGSSYKNLYGTLNGIIALGIAYTAAFLAIATVAWFPGAGWAEAAAAILGVAALVSAAVSFFLGGVVTSQSGVFVFTGSYMNSGNASSVLGGSPVDLYFHQFSTITNVGGTDYDLPTYWISNTATQM